MIFKVEADQVKQLDERQLVDLLRSLIIAELNKHSIPLRSGVAPAQITIPDGGEDARVSWSDGPDQTDWFPSRFTIFQSKKGTIGRDKLKKEVQTKSSPPKLKEALEQAISKKGAYVVVTNSAVVGTAVDERVEAIKEGITATGNDPSLLSEIKIYDCNRLAVWTNTHPSVALQLNAWQRGVNLGGFQTFEDWGKAPEIAEIPFQQCGDARFTASRKKNDPSLATKQSFEEIRGVISNFLDKEGRAVRIIGPSGFGKTRFVHQLIATGEDLPQDVLGKSQVIYCLYEDVKDHLRKIARQIADTGSRALLVVDDCPDEFHNKLSKIVYREGACLHLITIGVETTAYDNIPDNLIVELHAASYDLIFKIVRAINPQISSRPNASLIYSLSQGFPQMAVLAAQDLKNSNEMLTSVDHLVSRIVWGEDESDKPAPESLKIASLFTIFGMENDVAYELDEIATFFKKDKEQLFEDLQRFVKRGVLFRQGDYGEVRPIPLANSLSNQWLETKPAGTLEILFRSLSDGMKLKMVGRLSRMSSSKEISRFSRTMLAEAFPDAAALDSEFGSELLDRFVHLAPNETMERLDDLLSRKTIDELVAFKTGRRKTIHALEKLVFRDLTFDAAAGWLLRLGAAENEKKVSNNASNLFKGLYQPYLSRTEVAPKRKLVVLDAGLADGDQRVRKLCIEALEWAFKMKCSAMSIGSEYIGAGKALQDWQPRDEQEIVDYYRAVLSRLEAIAINTKDPHCQTALNIIDLCLRGLFYNTVLLDDIQKMIARLREIYPEWYGAALALNDWLYYDRLGADKDYQQRLRAYYDELLPTNPLKLIYYYSSASKDDIHDPDVCFDPKGKNNHHNYSKKRIHELIDKAPKKADYFRPLLKRFPKRWELLYSITVVGIVKHVDDPQHLLQFLLQSTKTGSDVKIVADLVWKAINGAAQKNRTKGLECLELALNVSDLEFASFAFFTAVGLDDELMQQAIKWVEDDKVAPQRVAYNLNLTCISNVSSDRVGDLVNTLLTKQERGAWAAIDALVPVLSDRSDPKEGQLLQAWKAAVINRALFDETKHHNWRCSDWCILVEKLFDGGHVDESFAAKLLDFIISVTSVEDIDVRFSFKNQAEQILRRVIKNYPDLFWKKYLEARETADEARKTDDTYAVDRLSWLFEVNFEKQPEPGVLDELPDRLYLPWMQEKKEERMPFILSWIRLFDDEKGARKWSDAFVSFIDDNVDRPERLNGLDTRLTTGVFIGPFANRLEDVCNLLRQLKERSENKYVRQWVDKKVSGLEQQITYERRQDANRAASWRA